jgi:predicted RNA-binding Zn ribbon-like protein
MGVIHEIETVLGEEFSDLAGWHALDFVNTVSGYVRGTLHGDRFQTYADLVAWSLQHGLLDEDRARRLLATAAKHPRMASGVLERARALRMAIYRVFTAASHDRSPEPEALDGINTELAGAMSNARIEAGADGFRWGWRATGADLDRVLWPIARSAADLLVSEKLERVHSCEGETCGWLFLDTSKNHSRRWCSMSDCGNTAKARRHYHRKVKGVEPAD